MKIIFQVVERISQWVFLIIILWFIIGNKKSQKRDVAELKEYWEIKDFKTDTIIYEVEYSKLPHPVYRNYVPPAVVINYVDSTKINHITLSMNDSLLIVIDSLKKQIVEISLDFIKKYPNASKLIYAEFSRDSLRLDLLSIRGTVSSLLYGTNFQRFRYQYVLSDGIHANPIKIKTNKFKSEFWAYGGYDLIQKYPLLGVDYSLSIGRFGIGSSFQSSLETNPYLELQLLGKYKLR